MSQLARDLIMPFNLAVTYELVPKCMRKFVFTILSQSNLKIQIIIHKTNETFLYLKNVGVKKINLKRQIKTIIDNLHDMENQRNNMVV